MIKDEEQLIANLMYRMHANEQARLDAALSSARADAVTRAEADRVRMESVTEELRKEREAHAETAELLNKGDAKVRNMEHTHSVVLSRITIERDSLKDMLDRQTPACNKLILEGHELRAERDALRAEVAALQERLRASIARGDFAQMEVAALKSQTPKHPVAVGESVRRTTEGSIAPFGTLGRVLVVWSDAYQVELRKGFSTMWAFDDCTPCDPPTASHDTPAGKETAQAAAEPKPGDVVRLVRVPTMEEYANWEDLFGVVGSLGIVKSLAHQVANVKYNDFTWEWPLSCVEVVTEATHDTEAGKAAAEAAVKNELDELKVGDLVEVFQASYPMTTIGDIGAGGIVVKIVPESAFECEHVQIDSNGKTRIPFAGMASIKDVRKVTT